jgi:hypothetical protein
MNGRWQSDKNVKLSESTCTTSQCILDICQTLSLPSRFVALQVQIDPGGGLSKKPSYRSKASYL